MGSSERVPAFAPGEYLRDEMQERNWSVEELARLSRLSVETVQGVCNERTVINRDISVGLSRAFGTSATVWANLQAAHSQFLLDLDDAHTKAIAETVEDKDAEIARLRAALEYAREKLRICRELAGRPEVYDAAVLGHNCARRALDGEEGDDE